MLLKVVIIWIGEKRDKSETAWKVRIIIKRAWHLYRNVLHLKVLIISSSKLSVFLFSVQFSHSVKSDSVTPWTAACQASLSITNSQSLPKPISIESGMTSNHLILCCPLLLPPSYPAPVFSNESVLQIRWTKYWSFSFSIVLPMDIQDLFPLGLTGFISLQSKGLSRVFFSTTVPKHQCFCRSRWQSGRRTCTHLLQEFQNYNSL